MTIKSAFRHIWWRTSDKIINRGSILAYRLIINIVWTEHLFVSGSDLSLSHRSCSLHVVDDVEQLLFWVKCFEEWWERFTKLGHLHNVVSYHLHDPFSVSCVQMKWFTRFVERNKCLHSIQTNNCHNHIIVSGSFNDKINGVFNS